MSPMGLRSEICCTCDVRQKLKGTDPISHQRGRPTSTDLKLSKKIIREWEKLFAGSRWVPDTRTDWPTDCRS
jgi:hypothetical protein